MLGFEKKMVGFIRRHIMVIALAAAVALSLTLRYIPRFYESGDMEQFLLPWYHLLKAEGLQAAMAQPWVNYNGLYLLLLWGATALPLPPVLAIKLPSILFDYLLAGALALCVWQLAVDREKWRRWLAAGAFILGIFLPIPLLNSAFWGQCDSIYAFFALMGLYFMLRRRYTPAFLFFAFSLAFKAQMLFLLPALIILYLAQRRFSLLQFLQGPALLLLLGLFLRPAGEGMFYGWTVYFNQAGTYPFFTMNYPNLYVSLQREFGAYIGVAVVAALAACLCMMAYIVARGYRVEGEALPLLMAWSVMTCTCLLPAVHERYGYLAEVLVWVYFLARPGPRRFALAFAVNLAALLGYAHYLFEAAPIPLEVLGVLNVLVYVALTAMLLGQLKRDNRAGRARASLKAGTAQGAENKAE